MTQSLLPMHAWCINMYKQYMLRYFWRLRNFPSFMNANMWSLMKITQAFKESSRNRRLYVQKLIFELAINHMTLIISFPKEFIVITSLKYCQKISSAVSHVCFLLLLLQMIQQIWTKHISQQSKKKSWPKTKEEGSKRRRSGLLLVKYTCVAILLSYFMIQNVQRWCASGFEGPLWSSYHSALKIYSSSSGSRSNHFSDA